MIILEFLSTRILPTIVDRSLTVAAPTNFWLCRYIVGRRRGGRRKRSRGVGWIATTASFVYSARELTPRQPYVCFVEVPCGQCTVMATEDLFIEELGLSDDTDKDPDYDPSAKENNKCISPTLSRSQRAEARQVEKEGKVQAVVDANKILMQPKKQKYKASNPRKKNSFVWQYFEKNVSMDGDESRVVVKCKYCDYILRYTSSTSAMAHHIKTKHRQVYKDAPIVAPGHTVKESTKGKSIMKSYTHPQRKISKDSSECNNLSRLLARFVITSNSPISIVENPQLIEFVEAGTQQRYSLPTKYFLQNNIIMDFLKE